jgi:hypothetical protein
MGDRGDAAEETPYAHGSMVIEREPDVVRAQFFDVDHHVRHGVHHGATLTWANPGGSQPPGPRRVRQETRVLGRVVAEAFVIEESPTGLWVKRFVEGPNAGGRYVATFSRDPQGHTRVDVEAFAPPHGFDNGLGKLSQLGVEKALQKLLQEHKRALEGYEPGRARGDVDRVLKALRDLTTPMLERSREEQRAIISNFLEGAAIVALADEVADAAERHTMQAAARSLCFVELDDESIEKLVAGTKGAVLAEGTTARCEKVGSRLERLGFAQLGLAFATLIAQVSHGIDGRELSALQRIANAGGLDDEHVAQLVHRIDAMLSGGA